MKVLETQRLALREMTEDDAEFMLDLLNQPSFLRFIGDRGVRTLADARAYISNGPVESYRRNGFGLYMVELKETAVSIGTCGLLQRAPLTDVDIGFAFLPAYWSQGYAFEAARATVAYARDEIGLTRLVAVVAPDNEASRKLLEKLGFGFEGMVRMSDGEPEILLYAAGAPQP